MTGPGQTTSTTAAFGAPGGGTRGGGTSGNLPRTGTNNVGPLAVVGLLTLVLGAGLVAAARRRTATGR